MLNTHVLHDVQESIVHVWLLCELDFDLVQIGQGIFDVESGLAGKIRLLEMVSCDCWDLHSRRSLTIVDTMPAQTEEDYKELLGQE